MIGLRGFLPIVFIYRAFVYPMPSDVQVFVTDKTEDLSGNIYAINMTSKLVAQLSGYKIIRPVAISYDSVEDRLYWSDVMSKEIRTSGLDGSDERCFLDLDTVAIADGVTIDSHNRLLFYTDTGNDVIVSVRLDDSSNKTTIVNTDLVKPRGITVFPDKTLVIWTDWSGWASIQLCKYDGSGRKTLVNTDIQWPNGITLDEKNEMLYWCDAGKHRIESIKLDGSQRKTILSETNTHYFGIHFFEGALFYTDWNSNFVRQISPNGSEISRIQAPRFKRLTGITVLRTSRCPDGYYGESCSTACGKCALGNPCDKSTGRCTGNCQDGYSGDYCTQEINTVTPTQGTADKGDPSPSTSRSTATTSLDVTVTATSPTDETKTEIIRWPRSESVKSVKTEKSPAIAGLSFTVVGLAITVGILAIYVYKYRREYLRSLTYDHLRRRHHSVSTDESQLNPEYSDMGENGNGDEPLKNPLSNKVCPDILIRDHVPYDETDELNASSEEILKKEEPRYISIGSLFP